MKLNRSIYPGLIWLAVIWILSSMPTRSLPTFNVIGFDKLAHILVYFILGILFNGWLKAKESNKYQAVFFYCVLLLLATADEFHQYYIPGRSVTVYDLMANSLGLATALLIYLKKT